MTAHWIRLCDAVSLLQESPGTVLLRIERGEIEARQPYPGDIWCLRQDVRQVQDATTQAMAHVSLCAECSRAHDGPGDYCRSCLAASERHPAWHLCGACRARRTTGIVPMAS